MKISYKCLDVPMPCPFHSCSPQAKGWDKKHTMIIATFENGERYKRLPKHQIGVNTPRIKRSMWEPMSGRTNTEGAVDCDLPHGMRPPKRTKILK